MECGGKANRIIGGIESYSSRKTTRRKAVMNSEDEQTAEEYQY